MARSTQNAALYVDVGPQEAAPGTPPGILRGRPVGSTVPDGERPLPHILAISWMWELKITALAVRAGLTAGFPQHVAPRALGLLVRELEEWGTRLLWTVRRIGTCPPHAIGISYRLVLTGP